MLYKQSSECYLFLLEEAYIILYKPNIKPSFNNELDTLYLK